MSYSPYDNVTKQHTPICWLQPACNTARYSILNRPWFAKLREMKTDNNKLLLYTNTEAGYGGASGRFKALKDRAREYAFLFALEGITK